MITRSNANFGNESIVDVKRGVLVNVRNMTEMQDLIYQRAFFTTARPDLSDVERYQWVLRLEMGEKLLQSMRHNLQREAFRVSRLYPLASRYERLMPFYEQYIQLSQPFIRGFKPSSQRDWEDQSRLVNYVEQKIFKIQKYGIQLNKRWTKPEEAKQFEDELTQRFSKEMRKPPKEAKKAQEED